MRHVLCSSCAFDLAVIAREGKLHRNGKQGGKTSGNSA